MYVYFFIKCVVRWSENSVRFENLTGICFQMGQILWDFILQCEVWHVCWHHNMNVGHWPIFHSQVILLRIFKIIWYLNIIFEIMHQCDTTDLYILQSSNFVWYLEDYLMSNVVLEIMDQCGTKIDLMKHVYNDLYFMAQWFCLISFRVFDGWMSCVE